jgi:hypothetical protein
MRASEHHRVFVLFVTRYPNFLYEKAFERRRYILLFGDNATEGYI